MCVRSLLDVFHLILKDTRFRYCSSAVDSFFRPDSCYFMLHLLIFLSFKDTLVPKYYLMPVRVITTWFSERCKRNGNKWCVVIGATHSCSFFHLISLRYLIACSSTRHNPSCPPAWPHQTAQTHLDQDHTPLEIWVAPLGEHKPFTLRCSQGRLSSSLHRKRTRPLRTCWNCTTKWTMTQTSVILVLRMVRRGTNLLVVHW